jgi:hypothetical protein
MIINCLFEMKSKLTLLLSAYSRLLRYSAVFLPNLGVPLSGTGRPVKLAPIPLSTFTNGLFRLTVLIGHTKIDSWMWGVCDEMSRVQKRKRMPVILQSLICTFVLVISCWERLIVLVISCWERLIATSCSLIPKFISYNKFEWRFRINENFSRGGTFYVKTYKVY